jgi:hypothetical protein
MMGERSYAKSMKGPATVGALALLVLAPPLPPGCCAAGPVPATLREYSLTLYWLVSRRKPQRDMYSVGTIWRWWVCVEVVLRRGCGLVVRWQCGWVHNTLGP